MAADHEDLEEAPLEFLRPPIPGGIGYVESVGRWLDNLMGHRKIERQARENTLRMIERLNRIARETGTGFRMAPDPPTMEAAEAGEERTRRQRKRGPPRSG